MSKKKTAKKESESEEKQLKDYMQRLEESIKVLREGGDILDDTVNKLLKGEITHKDVRARVAAVNKSYKNLPHKKKSS